PRWCFDLPLPSLCGVHQIINAGTAIACLEQLVDLPVAGQAIAKGLRHIEWPGRLQPLTRGALVTTLPAGWEVWLDGGHNPGAGAVLADTTAAWGDPPLYLVVGMLNSKDASGFLAPLVEHAKALRAVTIPHEENALPARAIAAAARSLGLPAQIADSVLAALRDLAKPAETGRILICGSLHLAGTVLAENG